MYTDFLWKKIVCSIYKLKPLIMNSLWYNVGVRNSECSTWLVSLALWSGIASPFVWGVLLLWLYHILFIQHLLSRWWALFCSYVVVCFLIDFIFKGYFRFTAKLRERYRDFPYTLCPCTRTAFRIIHVPRQSGTFVTTSEPTWTHHYYLKSIVYIRVHSWCCTCYLCFLYLDLFSKMFRSSGVGG